MGRQSRLTGSIRVKPPLTAAEMRKARTFMEEGGGHCVMFYVNRRHEETERGTLTVEESDTIGPASSACNAATIAEEVAAMIEHAGEHDFTGWIKGTDEDGTNWRVRVTGTGTVIRERAALLWPDQISALMDFVQDPEDGKVSAVTELLRRKGGAK